MTNKFFTLFKKSLYSFLQVDLKKQSDLWTNRLVFVIIVLISFSLFSNVSAQGNTSSGGCLNPTLKVGQYVNTNFQGVGDTPNSFSSFGNTIGAGLATASTILVGVCPEAAQQNGQFYESLPNDMKNGGLVGFAFNETYALFEKLPGINIPQHFAKHWLPQDLYNNTVYAQQGSDITAYAQLTNNGLDKIWTVVFNISMTAFILVIMVAGFMVMFRTKLQQGTVSVGNAISRVILGIVLALSSFTIGAIIIDLGKWLTRVVRQLIFINGLYGGQNGVVDIEGPISLAWGAFTSYGMEDKVTDGLTAIANILFKLFVTEALGTGGVPVLSGLMNLLFMLVIAVMIFVASLKIYFKLLSLYIKLVVSTIFGPLYALLGSIPGREVIITNWFKAMVADSVSIAAIYFFVNLAVYFMKNNVQFLSFTTSQTANVNSYISPTGGLEVSVLMGLMIFLMAASADDFIKEGFMIKESASLRAASDKGIETMQDYSKKGYGMVVGS